MKFLTAVKHRYKVFQNITLNEKLFQQSSEKHSKGGGCLPILKISQKNLQNNFLHFFTSWKHLYNLTIFRRCPVLGTFLKQIFEEGSSNILETLLCDYWHLPKDQHLFLSNHTFLTQKHSEFVKKYFP